MIDDFMDTHERKIQEKTDFEQWIFEYKLLMADVQADGNLIVYEVMLNTLLVNLTPYMSDEHRKEYDRIRSLNSLNNETTNYKRIEEKELLSTVILNDLGALFTPRTKMHIRKGVLKLWEMFPPWEEPMPESTPAQPESPATVPEPEQELSAKPNSKRSKKNTKPT